MNVFKLAFRAAAYHLLGRPIRKVLFLTYQLAKWWSQASLLTYSRVAEPIENWNPSRDIPRSTDLRKVIESYYPSLVGLLSSLQTKPKISVIIPVYKVPLVFLEEALLSVEKQLYDNWEICLTDDASGDATIDRLISEFQNRLGNRLKVHVNTKNEHICGASNRALALASGEYVALLDHDDRLYPNALAEMVRYINLHKHPDILYSDERHIVENGHPINDPFYKPKWSPYLHLSVNYTTHLTLYRTALVREVGGFRPGYEGAQDHDLMLRMVEKTDKTIVHVPFCLYQWRIHEKSTAQDVGNKPYAATSGEKAVKEACERRGTPADVAFEPDSMHYRVRFHLPKPAPKVSIIVATRDRFELVKQCLDSVFSGSTYPNYEVVVVDNGSTDPRCQQFFEDLCADPQKEIVYLRDDRPFNFGALNNRGAAAASGEFFLLLNNDTRVLTADWIEELLRHAALRDVGAVGCKLLYENDTIQHAGLLLMDTQVAVHSFRKFDQADQSYINMLNTLHEVSCVTAACLMISKEKYLAVGGLDEGFLCNGYGDVDLCLKLKAKGFTNLYTPYAKLYHYESVSRKQTNETFERDVMMRTWGATLLNDPFRNINLVKNEQFIVDHGLAICDFKANQLGYYLRNSAGTKQGAPFKEE